MSEFIKNSYLSIVILFSLFLAGCSSNQERPNVLLIMVDDLRPELGAYDVDIQSPSMDKLASQSIVFERAYCNVPVCGASRASLLSGIRPGMNRFINYYTRLDEDLPGAVSMPAYFREQGYYTVSLGKVYHYSNDDSAAWHEIWDPPFANKTGWRDYLTEENLRLFTDESSRGKPWEKAEVPDSVYNDGQIAQKAIRKLENLSRMSQPFFLAVGFLKPHLPFNAPDIYWDMYDSSRFQLPASYFKPESIPERAYHNFGELRNYHGVPKIGPVSAEMALKLIHGYYACVSYVDAQIGILLDQLDALGLAENTIISLIGDHGWNLGEHMLWCKHCNFETSLHVPFVLKVPGQSPQQITDIVEYVDIFPTLVSLSGMDIPNGLDGEDLKPVIERNARSDGRAISKFHNGVTLIAGDYFYTEYITDKLETTDRMLFDHAKDPMELHNLLTLPSYTKLGDSLSHVLRASWGNDFESDNRLKRK